MTTPPEKPEGASASPPEEDLTGRSRIVRNVVASWSGHLVFVIAGFFLPRLIDADLGPERLGIWDFAWSLITYFGIMQGGIGSSVNRYVSKFRAERDFERMNQVVNTVMVVQIAAGILVAIATLAATWLLEPLFGSRLGGLIDEARWLVLLVGLGLMMQMFFDSFSGIMTGYHRWELHNGINAGLYAITVVVMAIALGLGGGLVELGAVSLAGTTATELVRFVVARRIAPELRIAPQTFSWATFRQQMLFGGKVLIPRVSTLLQIQTTNVLIIAFLGPAALAVYARALSLVRHVNTFIGKFSYVLIPVTSSIQASTDRAQLRHMFLRASEAGLYLTLPVIAGLVIFGDELLTVWMGSDYARGDLLTILAVGHLMTIVHQPMLSMLAGINAHGRPGIAKLAAALVSVTGVYVALGPLGYDLGRALLFLVVPMVLVDGIVIPLIACRRLGISLIRYYVKVLRAPVTTLLPFFATLLVIKLALPDRPGLALLVSILAGGVVLSAVYWRWALPESTKTRIRARLVRS